MKSAIDNLKQKPKEQKTAVAGGVATAVVAILLILWAIFYLKYVLTSRADTDLPIDQIDFGALRQDREDAAAAMGGESNYFDSGNDTPFGEAKNSYSF